MSLKTTHYLALLLAGIFTPATSQGLMLLIKIIN